MSFQWSWAKDAESHKHFPRLLNQVSQSARGTTLDEFLIEMKEQQPDLFASYLLAYRSRSLQKASPMFPRIIMFSPQADFAITFNGHEKFRGHNDLEVMRFNREDRKFEFFEISFKNGEKPQLSNVNPRKCLDCHQGESRANADPRPNWEPYNTWPGFYGSLDDDVDLFKNNMRNDSQYNKDLDQILFYEVDNEQAWFETYKKDIKPQHPRYKILEDDMRRSRYSSEKTLNGTFTDLIAELNFQRVGRLMRATPIFDKIKWTVMGYAKCNTFFIGEDGTYDWLKTNSAKLYPHMPEQIYQTYPQVFHYSDGLRSDGGPIIIERPPLIFPIARVSDVISLMFEPFHVDTEDWSMDFKSDNARMAAFERFGTPSNPNQTFLNALKVVWAEDKELMEADCEKLKMRSLEQVNINTVDQIKDQSKQADALIRKPSMPLLQRCASCHSDDASLGDIPSISFLNPKSLARELKTRGYKRGTLLDEIKFRLSNYATSEEQMPPRGAPSTVSKNELLRYLESLESENP